MVLGIIATVLCYYAIMFKNKIGYDDSLDAFGIHGVGGIVGAIVLSFFIRDAWMDEAVSLAGGDWSVMQQLGVQVAAVLIAIAYAAIMTLILLWVINKLFKFRSSSESEMMGLDSAYHGEHGYGMLNPN